MGCYPLRLLILGAIHRPLFGDRSASGTTPRGDAHAFRHGNAALLDSLHAPMAARQERLEHVIARTTMGYTHLVTAEDVRMAGELGALLDKEFLAQDLPKFPPNAETTSESFAEAV